jgi:hypothetical protein
MGSDDNGAASAAHCLHWNMVLNETQPHLGSFGDNDNLQWLTYGQVPIKQPTYTF